MKFRLVGVFLCILSGSCAIQEQSASDVVSPSIEERLTKIEEQLSRIEDGGSQAMTPAPVTFTSNGNIDLTPQTHVYANQHSVAQSEALRDFLDTPDQPDQDYYAHRIGTWNIENLSPTRSRGFPELRGSRSLSARDHNQLLEIAEYLERDIGPDALVVTEIHADIGGNRSSQLEVILDAMGDNWEYQLGTQGGAQRLGILYNANRVRIKASAELKEGPYDIQGADIADRDPMAWWLELTVDDQAYNDLILVGVHLKSQQKNVHNHMAALAKVFGDLEENRVRDRLGLPSKSEEIEIAIVGDFNNSTHKRRDFKFVFDYAAGLGYQHLGGDLQNYPGTRVNGSEIDHILISEELSNYIVPDSFHVHGVTSRRQINSYRETFSDHFPVTFDVFPYLPE